MLLYTLKQVFVIIAFIAIAYYCYCVISAIDEDDKNNSD